MTKPLRHRSPHGATSAMVMDALVRLHTRGGRRETVCRADLLAAVHLPETTVDDRLRTLIKDGRVTRVGRALYVPKRWPGRDLPDYELPGTVKITNLPGGLVVKEEWSKTPRR